MRGFLTLRVFMLRDDEEQTRVTPRAGSYLYLFHLHRLPTVLLIGVLAIVAWRAFLFLTVSVQVPG